MCHNNPLGQPLKNSGNGNHINNIHFINGAGAVAGAGAGAVWYVVWSEYNILLS